MNRYFVEISYLGKNYFGWQVQPNANTVQAEIEKAFSLILRQTISVVGAGRTDTGVHSLVFFAHFDCALELNLSTKNGFIYNVNQVLPCDIAVNRIVRVHPEAHARFSALSRTYKYYISQQKNPFTKNTTWQYSLNLDVGLMQQAAAMLLKVSDFSSFCKQGSDVKTNVCTVTCAEWTKEGDTLVFTIRSNRFLRDMVRSIVGTLVDVGRGKTSLSEFSSIIEQRDRGAAGTSAPACGLMLVDVEYPEDIYY